MASLSADKPEPAERRSPSIARRALAALPLAVMVAGAANHAWLVHRDHLSPWLGAGFGMFASSDVGSARVVYLFAILPDGREHRIWLPETYRETILRFGSLPTAKGFARLAQTVRDSLSQEALESLPETPAVLRIEVWRTSFEPGTLRPTLTRIAERTFPFTDGERD